MFVHLHRERYNFPIIYNTIIMDFTTTLDDLICFRLYALSRLVTQYYRPLLQPLGLTYPQYLVMMALWEHDNQLVGDLCRRLMLDTNTLTPLLQRMEKEGLVIRTRGIVDGRQTLVTLTKKGVHLEEAAKEIPATLAAQAGLDADGAAEVERLSASLDELIQRFSSKEKTN